MPTQLINFLQEELEISAAAIALALRQAEPDLSQLPMILWQYGLVTLSELERVFDWLESSVPMLDSQVRGRRTAGCPGTDR